MADLVRNQATLAEYRALEETNQIVELIDGEIVVNAPLDIHQKALWRLMALLLPVVSSGEARVAPTGLYLDDENSYEPDFFWISPQNETCSLQPDGRYWRGAPDLVVEILSSSTAYRDRGIKFQAYERHGVREYWMIDPEAEFIEVYVLRDGKYVQVGLFAADERFQSSVFDGADVDVALLFT
ncbi:MAG: Uma2 family endonuclease [Anaerolineae bacterium]|nr:Uma2 family endonuclease [Anaerolineae bacterium]